MSPPAVTTGPPFAKNAPVGGSCGIPKTPPFGTCHLIVPVFRSIAVSCDHGGLIGESPLLICVMKLYGTVYAVKSCWIGARPPPPPAPPPPRPPRPPPGPPAPGAPPGAGAFAAAASGAA